MTYQYFEKDYVNTLLFPNTKKLCIFASYEKENISIENIIYANTLAEYFDTVIYITNNRTTNTPSIYLSKNIKYVYTYNMCYDFGMWFRILKNLDISNIENITLVNDSMILLNPNKLLKILNEYNDKKMWGFTDSNEINYHIQSYFLAFRGLETISVLKEFVDNSNIHNDVNLDKMDIVKKYEIGISQFIISNNICITPVYKITDVLKVNSVCESIGENSTYRLWDRLLILEMPLVKKTKEHSYKIDKL